MLDRYTLLSILVTALIFTFILAVSHFSSKKRETFLRKQNENLGMLINTDGFALQKRIIELEAQINSKAQNLYTSWRDKEVDLIKSGTLKGHRSAVAGQVAERFVPFMPVFTSKYNPKDARFIGSPIDLIVFNGADGDDIKEIIFIEVKTGQSSLTKRQQQIRNLIQEGSRDIIKWEQVRV